MNKEIEKVMFKVYDFLMESMPDLSDRESKEVRAEVCRVLNQCSEHEYNYYGSWVTLPGDPTSICHRVAPYHSIDEIIVTWQQCIIEATIEKHEAEKADVDTSFKRRFLALLKAYNWSHEALTSALEYIDLLDEDGTSAHVLIDAQNKLVRNLEEFHENSAEWENYKSNDEDDGTHAELSGLYDCDEQEDEVLH